MSTLEAFPDAKPFLEGLLARNTISPPIAHHYVKIAARLSKQGRLGRPDLLTHVTEKTAANAYWRWVNEAYSARIDPVLRALAQLGIRDKIPTLRRHSLVGPYEGKTVPRLVAMPTMYLDAETRTVSGTPARYEMQPCAGWTLHISPDPKAPVHDDPCETCIAHDLTEAQLGAIAVAFESAWGHRDLSKIPPEQWLFGQPPPVPAGERAAACVERIVAIAPATSVSMEIERCGGSIVQDAESFQARLLEGAEGVYISRKVVGVNLETVLDAVRKAWSA